MTVASEVSRSGPYSGNGVTTVFDYDFRITKEEYLKVIRADADANETVLALGSDYTVFGVGDDDGSITIAVAPAVGLTITIIRDVPFTQETDLENQGPYFAETVEAALDLAAMRDQQLQEQLTRAVLIPISENDPDGTLSTELAKNITRLGQSADEIDTVASIKDDVVTVAGIAGDVALLADVSGVLSGTASAVRMDEKMFTGDGVDTTWTLDRAPGVEENVLVWVGGAIQDTADYSVVGTTLTISPAVANGVEIRTLIMTLVTANDIEQMRDDAVEAAAAAEAAKTLAQAYASNQMVFDAVGIAAATAIPLTTYFVRLNGGTVAGDSYGGLFTDTPNGSAIAFMSSGGTARNWYRVRDVDAVRITGIDNYSMPLALDFATMYVKATGTDDTGGDVSHGTSEAKAFLTWEAAILHAKSYVRFKGRLNTVFLLFDNVGVRAFNLGSNMLQGDDWFPFTIGISSIDSATEANWAKFDSITCGTWKNNAIYVSKVDLAYCGTTRLNTLRVNEVGIRAMRDEFNNKINLISAFYSAFGSKVHVFGRVTMRETCTYTSAFLYCQQRGNLLLENGDSPIVFPMFELINAGFITSPYKYRTVYGSQIYTPANVYPQLTYAANYYVDATSFSTQTQTGEELGKNAGAGGPVVIDVGNTAAGYFIRADGYCEQWGNVVLTGLAVGRTNTAATIVLDKELISGSYIVEGGTNNMDVRVGLHGTPLTTGFPLGAWNHSASPAAATARWRVCGYVAV